MPTAISTQALTTNRVGLRSGEVSELTVIAPLKPGGADHLRAALRASEGRDSGISKVGSVHDLRWVIFDNDTRVLFATAYDGDWDAYIDDFATKIPQIMDAFFGFMEGYPGITSPSVKDYIANHQITAVGWYCAENADQRLGTLARNAHVTAAVDTLLDAVNP